MNISVLVPTRGRPSNMQRMTESLFATCINPDKVEVIFYMDDDDTKPVGAMAQNLAARFNVKWLFGQRIVLSKMWNECYKLADADICMHSDDDVIFRTPGWDETIMAEFSKVPDKIVFVYPRDGIVDSEDLGTHGFLHRNWVDTVGYFVPPYFTWCYNDTWLTEVSKTLGRLRYLPDVLVEHIHPCVQKTPMDATYSEASRRGVLDNMLDLYNSKADERKADAAKLQAFIEGFGNG